MNRSRNYLALIAVSFFAASVSSAQVKQKASKVSFNTPEMIGVELSPNDLASQAPSEGPRESVVGLIDGFSSIAQPTADYVSRTTLFAITPPDLTVVNSITDAPSGCTVTFTPPLQARTVGQTWATWGSPPDTEGTTPRILYSNGATSITLAFTGCNPTTAGFEAEPNPFQEFAMTATFSNGGVQQGSITRTVSGQAGARLFAADGAFDQIVFSSSVDFAIAQVRFAQGVQAVLQGQVTDDTTGDPIQGARVQAVGGVTRSTLTDATGNYRLFLPPDTYDVTASAFGYASQTVAGVVVEDATTLDFALTSASRHAVSGTVTTADGTPVAGAEVRILSTPIPPTRSDTEGNYSFANVPDGTYDIRAGGGGCLSSQTQTVTFADDIVVNFTIPLRSDTFGHTCSDGLPFDWMPGDTLSPLVGDDDTSTIPLPFTFNYYGTNYTNITISTNGNAHFGPPNPSYVSMCLPSSSAISGLVAGFWDDLYVGPGGAGNIYTKVDVDAVTGLGIFVIEWRDVGFCCGMPPDRITLEIILYEGSNAITFQYNGLIGRGDGRLATIGIQNLGGTDGLQYSCRAPVVAAGKRIDFYAPP